MSSQRASQLVEAGLWLRLSGDHDGARRLFEQALKLDPDNARAKQLLDAQAPGTAKPEAPSAKKDFVLPELDTDSRTADIRPPTIAAVTSPSAAAPAKQSLSAMDVDWGWATGLAPEAPGQNAAREEPAVGVRTVKLGDAPANVVLTPRHDSNGPGAASGYNPFDDANLVQTDPATKVVDPPVHAAADDEGFDIDLGAPPSPPTVQSSSTLVFSAHAVPPPPLPSLGVPKIDPVPPQPPGLVEDATSAWDSRSNPGIDLGKTEATGVGFDLITSEAHPPPTPARGPAQLKSEIETLLRGAKDLLDLDDHTGAIELMMKAQELDPTNPEVQRLKERSEKTLIAMYESKLGHLDAMPRVKLKDDEIIWLNLDHRAGFVLAQIDGMVTFEDVFAVSGMSRLDTARILAQLVEEGVVSRG